MKRPSVLSLIILLLLALTACGEDETVPPPPTVSLPTPASAATLAINPLTGSPTAVPIAATAAATAVPTVAIANPTPIPTIPVTLVTSCQPNTAWPVYTVAAGDTLFNIAQRVGSSVDALAAANCLANINRLDVGQQIHVPQLPGGTASTRQRIQFAPGAASAHVTDFFKASATEYLLAARAGQMLRVVHIPTHSSDRSLYILGEDGILLAQAGVETTVFLPKTQDYIIGVAGPAGAQYDVNFFVSPNPVIKSERIQFDPGASSATLGGTLAWGQVDEYIFRANGGQQVSLNSLSASVVGTVVPSIRTADGRLLLPYAFENAGRLNFVLPESGEFVLSLLETNPQPTNSGYSLNFSIVGGSTTGSGGLVIAEPTVIQFAPGATSAAFSGAVAQAELKPYEFRASAGQWVFVTIQGAAVIMRPASGPLLPTSLPGWQYFNNLLITRLPADGLYTLDVFSPALASNSYTMTVTIVNREPQRVEFAAGAISAEILGQIDGAAFDVYVLRAAAGQTMKVEMTSENNAAAYKIIGVHPFETEIPTPSTLATTVTLPATQDYYIAVGSGQTSGYRLVVTIE